MIKYCLECKHSKIKKEPYDSLKCFNPLVNKNDVYMVSSTKGEGYGSDCLDQRRYKAYFWMSGCGIQGRFWESKSEVESLVEL